MANTTENLGLSVYDFNTDFTSAFVNGVAGLSDSNMHKIDKAITEKVTLNDTQANINFKENEVIQDGLVDNTNRSLKCFLMSSIVPTLDNGFYIPIDLGSGVITDDGFGISPTFYNNELRVRFRTKSTEYVHVFNSYIGMKYNLYVCYNDGVCTSILNGEIKTTKVQLGSFTTNNFRAKEKNIITYNRPLTLAEIQHNFSVLNNTPSISAIETTDASSNKTSFLFATDSDHIMTRTGHTEEERYTALLKKFGKKYTSDGSDITVENGIESQRVLSGKISGKTVKQFVAFDRNMTIDTTTTKNVSLKYIPTEANKQYYAIFNVKSVTGTPKLEFRTHQGIVNFTSFTLGLNKIAFTTPSTELPMTPYLRIDNSVVIEGNSLVLDYFLIVENDNQFVSSYIPFGLSSTQSILSNNGLSYPIYEPTINGKTRVMKATKGTQNWIEISADETRDTTTYDYKLESDNDLGSISDSLYDYIDRARKVKIVNTKEVTFDGSTDENWSLYGTNTNVQYFVLSRPTDSKASTLILVNNSNSELSMPDKENSYIGANNFNYSVLKSKATTVEQFRTWLQVNPITVRYQLTTPIEIPMTDEEIRQYDDYRKVIELGGVGDIKDTLEIQEDGSGIYTQNTLELQLGLNWNWAIMEAVSNDVTTYFGATSALAKASVSSKTNVNVICNTLEGSYVNRVWDIRDKQVLATNDTIVRMRLFNSNLTSIDVEGLKTWLEANPTTIRYQLASPIITYIPKELMPTILTQTTNKFSSDSAVKPSTIELTVPIDKVADLEKRLAQVEAIMTSTSNLSLSVNYIEDEYSKNNKLEEELL